MSGRTSDGQATLEYLAVLGVVVTLLVLASTVTAGPAIANGVGRGFQRAFCLVARVGCATVDARPCTVRTSNTGAELTAKFAFFRIGAQAGLLRAERSDGTVSLTLLEHLDAGLTAGVGEEGHLRLGHVEVGEGAVAELDAVARLGGGRVWNVSGKAAADALQRRLVEVLGGDAASRVPVVGSALHVAQHVLGVGDGRDLPSPASRVMDARAALSASLKMPGGNGLSVALDAGIGATQEISTGRVSVLLRLDGEAGALMAGGLGGLSTGGTVSFQVTYDRSGKPVELTVAGSGHGSEFVLGHGVLPESLSGRAGQGTSVSASVVLDLQRPDAALAVHRVTAAMAPARVSDLMPAVRGLAAMLASEGRLDVQRYGTRESGYGAGAEIGLGVEAGIDAEVTRTTLDLLDAWTRPPGGAWQRRIECLDG